MPLAIALPASDPSSQKTNICTKCACLIDPSNSSLQCLSCMNIFHSTCLKPSSFQRCSDCRICKCCKTRISTNTECIQCSQCKGLFHNSVSSNGGSIGGATKKNCSAQAHNSQLSPGDEWRCLECLSCKYCSCKSPQGTGWSKLREVKRASWRKEARWMNGNSTCKECWLVEQLGQQCPICLVLYAEGDESVPMITCDECARWIHVACDSRITMAIYNEMTENEEIPYFCPLCIIKRNDTKLGEEKIQNSSDNDEETFQLAIEFFTKAISTRGSNVIEREAKENSPPNASISNSSTIDFQSHSPPSLICCLFCWRQSGEENDWLMPLFPLDISAELTDSLVHISNNMHDVFIHQKCAFYASMACKEDSAERFCEYLASRAERCKECSEKGALIWCVTCKGYFHHFCHKKSPSSLESIKNSYLSIHQTATPNHKLLLEPYRPELFSSLHKSLNRRFLSRFQCNSHSFSEMMLKFQSGIIVKTSENCEALRVYNRNFELQRTIILDKISNCSRLTLFENRKAFKASLKSSIDYSLDGAASNRKESSSSIRVVPSRIAGIGVIAAKPFAPGETVIEYIGEAIGKCMANKREKLYEQQRGMGSCYMFKIDDDCIIDATCTGNRARFINHSCDPNCRTKTICNTSSNGGGAASKLCKKIIIYCCRKIEIGEEICYDYKFPLEDAKIPCNCGAFKCRGFMN